MPHVVLEGDVDLARFAREFEPILERRAGGDVLRADGMFLSSDAQTLLVDALAIEARRKQSFYVMIASHERSTTVRIDPTTRPERSEGVKELVALVAAELLARTPGARISVTNLVLPSRS